MKAASHAGCLHFTTACYVRYNNPIALKVSFSLSTTALIAAIRLSFFSQIYGLIRKQKC